jgi:ATP-dependent helicase/nuclease subunit A
MSTADAQARARAVDPLVSCCVSAPAGSGKTELLIQRFLALLARVQEPESVVAITFTRKAAAEMRARLLAALEAARAENPVSGAHERRTRDLALGALEVDRQRGWRLLATPARLRVRTIDSLCGELARQMPVLSGAGGELRTTDDADPLYREATGALLASADDAHTAAEVRRDIATLLSHLDNDWNSATELLLRLLRRRDQWQRLLGAEGGDLRQRDALGSVIRTLREQTVARARTSLGARCKALEALLAYRVGHLAEAPPACLRDDDGNTWGAVVDVLLTRSGTWRRSLTRREGFPSDDADQREQKQRMQALIGELEQDGGEALRDALLAVRDLPNPDSDPGHWEALQALLRLLPRLSALLLLAFRRHGTVDHGQVALAALHALGDDEAPSDLALRLEHRIEHLLVDEFQDTSSGQFELLRRLTRGWAEHNESNPRAPRTLMLVGDAMQSIYGFREANVGLFIRAREEGIGDLFLEPLDLTANFRSRAGLVDWVNSTFRDVFPDRDDPLSGAVTLSAAVAARSGGGTPRTRVFVGDGGPAAETDWLCEQLEAGHRDPGVLSIGVLGRTRRLLQPLLAGLRERGIPYAGRDLDGLARRMVVSDLLTLCEVLQSPWSRYSWLAFLRAPWVALDHAELLVCGSLLANAGALLAIPEDQLDAALAGLDTATVTRLGHVRAVLQWAEHYRDRLALRVWVEETWLRLGGAGTLSTPAQHSDAEQFLQVLETLEQAGGGLRMEQLKDAVDGLYAAPGDERAKIQVMTLHKSKGLEFDWVFLPALDGGTARSDDELLLWDELLLAGHGPAFLLDIKSARDARGESRVYDFLKRRRRQKSALEAARLLYVGCTRAAQRLYLSGSVGRDAQTGEARDAASGSLLAMLGPALESAVQYVDADAGSDAATTPEQHYRRLQSMPVLDARAAPAQAAPVDLASNRLSRAYGVALHRVLEALAQRDALPEAIDEALNGLLRAALLEAGCEPAMLGEYARRGAAALDRTLADAWARWMLAPARHDRAAELPLGVAAGDAENTLIVDYSFIDEQRDERWVVDYKSAVPGDAETPDEFFERQALRYADQLRAYRDAFRALEGRPVRCALYFPELGRHHELQFVD